MTDSSITPPTSHILLFHQDFLLPQIPSRCVASTQPGDHVAFDGGFVHAVSLDFQNGVAQAWGHSLDAPGAKQSWWGLDVL